MNARRHTDRRPQSVGGGGGYPCRGGTPWLDGVPPRPAGWLDGVPPGQPDGVPPLSAGWGTPPPPGAGQGTPPAWTWDGVPPPQLDGVPPHPCELTDKLKI